MSLYCHVAIKNPLNRSPGLKYERMHDGWMDINLSLPQFRPYVHNNHLYQQFYVLHGLSDLGFHLSTPYMVEAAVASTVLNIQYVIIPLYNLNLFYSKYCLSKTLALHISQRQRHYLPVNLNERDGAICSLILLQFIHSFFFPPTTTGGMKDMIIDRYKLHCIPSVPLSGPLVPAHNQASKQNRKNEKFFIFSTSSLHVLSLL